MYSKVEAVKIERVYESKACKEFLSFYASGQFQRGFI